jgi:Glycosyl transferase family 2
VITPRVSVVMPVLNAEAYIAQAIGSVLEQTLEELELIVVDDGSTDTSRAIVDRIASADARVRLVANERNLGISAALNQGCRAAQAPFIARLDADDVALPHRLARQLDFLHHHPAVAVVGGGARVIDSAGRQISTMRFPTDNRLIRSALLRHNCFAHPTVMLRQAALLEVGGYRFDQCEDYDLWLRLSERFELANLTEPLILYRVHTNQLSLTDLEERVKGALAVRTAARRRLATGEDPLNGIRSLTPEIFDRLAIADSELSRALEHEWLSWATVLVRLGRHEEAERLVGQASRRLGARAPRAFAAAIELKSAEELLGAGQAVAGASHVIRALRREPRYAFARLRAWLADRC